MMHTFAKDDVTDRAETNIEPRGHEHHVHVVASNTGRLSPPCLIKEIVNG
jgi:hypothetical protein